MHFLSSVEEQSVTSSLDLAPCLAISFLATSNLSQPAPLPFFQPLNPLLSDTDASQAAPGWREKIGRFEIVLDVNWFPARRNRKIQTNLGISDVDWSQFAELNSGDLIYFWTFWTSIGSIGGLVVPPRELLPSGVLVLVAAAGDGEQKHRTEVLLLNIK